MKEDASAKYYRKKIIGAKRCPEQSYDEVLTTWGKIFKWWNEVALK